MAAKRRSDTGPLRAQSPAEEIANSVSHGAGLLAALVGAPFLVARAARADDLAFLAGACLFATTVILAYLASTIYHALPAGRAKQVSRVLDHAAIFLLIAGTYTPFALGVLRGALGWTLFGIVWALALTGIVLRI
ncbi:MAG: hemolysin III family protein, partial [Actinobacteria bacterium]|nr:hemolysin III family protein [Actinomycetota bacterium]NIT98786.1 hemolysin III family protein [Actinomycetota bacterium]NIU22411.1 hemolysin III family protein [Actinomycetota bacterium]NIV58987.1 hemolysin III family protein [Actinomycetota bacterium]NIV90571.1 hemolysin III family protein [Actinomycetota bacterium]